MLKNRCVLLSQTVVPFCLEPFLLNVDEDSIVAFKSLKNLKKMGLASKFNLSCYNHLKTHPLWFCSFCKSPYLSTQRHKCISILTCQIPLSNGKKCEFQLSSNKRDNFLHHKYHTFCHKNMCSIHSSSIFVSSIYNSEEQIKNIQSNLSDLNVIKIDCSKFCSNIEKRDHFISIMSFICKIIKPEAYQLCHCTNFCLCKKSLFLSEPAIIQSHSSKASKSFTTIAKESLEFKESGHGTRILGFDSFSVSKSKQNKNCKDVKKGERICDLATGVKNFQSACRALRCLDQDLSIVFNNYKRKNIFVMSFQMFDMLKLIAPNHPTFESETNIVSIKNEASSIQVETLHLPEDNPAPPSLHFSKRSLMNSNSDNSSDDFQKISLKPRKKKLKPKKVFKGFGKKSYFSSDDENLDDIFM